MPIYYKGQTSRQPDIANPNEKMHFIKRARQKRLVKRFVTKSSLKNQIRGQVKFVRRKSWNS